ncbi:hypothetical protein RIR_jg11854.t1 [Rhizophagus irregularis DAOM 181602=DAOM 197198]|nr:hypothetical protein RhiirB3_445378 [Rhizophagus irregularis]GBC32443.2 hypothetical protein RIR_jg11854.t1 [Rhizophagus irregularis DAOM 181602=DAOM 197198]
MDTDLGYGTFRHGFVTTQLSDRQRFISEYENIWIYEPTKPLATLDADLDYNSYDKNFDMVNMVSILKVSAKYCVLYFSRI